MGHRNFHAKNHGFFIIFPGDLEILEGTTPQQINLGKPTKNSAQLRLGAKNWPFEWYKNDSVVITSTIQDGYFFKSRALRKSIGYCGKTLAEY